MVVIPNKLIFEKRYGDDSGVEYAVRYEHENNRGTIEIEHVDKITIPIEEVEWIMSCLEKAKATYDDVIYEIQKEQRRKENPDP